MRFIYKAILGLLIFNTVLLMLASYFPTSGQVGNPIDVTGDHNYTKFKLGGSQPIFTFGLASATIMGFSVALGIIGSWAIKSTIPLAGAVIGGLVTSLYIGPASVLYSFTQNTLIIAIISLIGLILGIMVGFTVIEWFANQSGADT